MRQDLNLRPAVLETAALTGLSYAPKSFRPTHWVQDGRYLFTIMGGRQKVPLTPLKNMGGVGELAVRTVNAPPK